MRFPLASTLVVSLLASLGTARAEDRYFDSDGVRLRYVVAGKGEPVVLVHGFIANVETMWVKNAFGEPKILAELAKDFQVIAFDCRGHGKSGKPHDPKQYGREMAEDVIRLLDHLHIKKAHVVGYSMGAMIAGKLLATYPDRLRSVTLGGGAPASKADKAWLAFTETLAESLEQGKGIGPLLVALTPPDQPKPTPEQAASLGKLALTGQDEKALAAVVRGFAGLAVTPEQLKANRVPVFIVYGDREGALKERIGQAEKLTGNATVKVIAGGDHITTAARPEFRKAVQEFLKAHRE